MKPKPTAIEKDKCKGHHFFDILNWSHVVIGDEDKKSGIVICRKCGELKIVKILNEYEN